MKKRVWSIEEKVAIIRDVDAMGIVLACRKHGIYATTYYDWKRKYDKGGPEALEPQYSNRESGAYQRIKRENELLKKLLAEKELELQMKTELLKKKMQEWKSVKR